MTFTAVQRPIHALFQVHIVSFIIVNTGRAASRAFSIDLFGQADVLTIPRYHFDRVVTAFITDGDEKPLMRLAERMDAVRRAAGKDQNFGIVFHGMRPRLAHPFDDPKNTRFLKAVRDRLKIDQVFLVARNPETLALSELNRRLAVPEGDWTFEDGHLGWQRHYTFDDIARLRKDGPADGQARRKAEAIEIEKTTEDLSRTTGGMHTIWNVFAAVFDDLSVVPYERFIEDPDGTMQAIGKRAGVKMTPCPLSSVKLNGLGNRFLIYNPIVLNLPENVQTSRKERFMRKLRGRPPRKAAVRFRFELRDVIAHCADWGSYIPTGADCSAHFKEIERELGHPIALGVNAADLHGLPAETRSMLLQPAFLQLFMEALGPVFQRNYAFFRQHYKENVYLRALPESARDIFMSRNAAEIDAFDRMIASGEIPSLSVP